MIDFTGQNAVFVMLSALLNRFIPGLGIWIANMISTALMARLSRRDEFEADAYASALLLKAGIGTGPQKSLFRKLEALTKSGGVVVLKGNLAPKGAVLKPSAATPSLMVHRGRAVVFEDIDDYKAKINDEALDIDETCVMVLKNCGPKGYPGMAEVGNMGLPPKVLRKGITDMVRISDARMSGTAFGTVCLHTSPEAAVGGPLAVVQNGDYIELDVPNRRLHLDISDEELARRLAAWKPTHSEFESGYGWLHQRHVEGADTGADRDFLKGCRGAPVGRDSH